MGAGSGRSLRYRAALTLRRDWQLWVLMLPALAFFIIFCYFPMYGVQIAFRDYKAALGITGSKWVGLKYFEKFFSSYYCGRMFLNTFLLNLYGLIFGFPIPILLAIMLNQLNRKRFKGFAQTAIYVPHFISTVVLAGMIYLFFSPTNGIINHLIIAEESPFTSSWSPDGSGRCLSDRRSGRTPDGTRSCTLRR